jgi:hypothetical protein
MPGRKRLEAPGHSTVSIRLMSYFRAIWPEPGRYQYHLLPGRLFQWDRSRCERKHGLRCHQMELFPLKNLAWTL